ncbi:MAG: glycosyltransferase [Acidobacteriaceae bacterium]
MRTRAISAEMATVCVSVVIPTRNRPEFVVTAVASALEQNFASLEVIVVVDGEDRPTREALSGIADARLKVVNLEASMGGAEGRNAGVRAARGEWIAFLDDDDEWLPHKLSRQMVTARQSAALWPVISSRMIVRRPAYDSIAPLRSYDAGRPLSEFLFCRKPLRDGPYAMQTSTLMVRREMMLAVPFRSGLKRHQDWDWLLRAERVPGVEFRVVGEPLVIYHTGDARESVGRAQDWEFSMHWGAEMRGFFSAKAYAWFLATECASRAAKSRAGLKTYAEILRRFVFDGRPSIGSAMAIAGFLGLPRSWRERAVLRASAQRRRDGALPVARRKAVQTTLGMEL